MARTGLTPDSTHDSKPFFLQVSNVGSQRALDGRVEIHPCTPPAIARARHVVLISATAVVAATPRGTKRSPGFGNLWSRSAISVDGLLRESRGTATSEAFHAFSPG